MKVKDRVRKANKIRRMTGEELRRFKENKIVSQRERRWRNRENTSENHRQQTTAFSSRQSFGKAKKKLLAALPRSGIQRKKLIYEISKDVGLAVHPIDRDMPTTSTTDSRTELSEDVKMKVREFYERDDISRQSPGMRDTIVVKEEDQKKTYMKRHLLLTIAETYKIFKSENMEVKIGKSKFAELRPRHVLLQRETPANVCVCVHHANLQFLLDAIPKDANFPSTAREFVNSVVCDRNSFYCMTSSCGSCKEKLGELRRNTETGEDCQVKPYQWTTENQEKQLEKRRKEMTLCELLNLIEKKTVPFLKHCYIKDQQSAFFKEKMKSEDGVCSLQVDFSQNFALPSQDEVQASHWISRQFTFYTAVAWHQGECKSFVIISDSLEHNKYAVNVFNKRIVNLIIQKWPTVHTIHIFSEAFRNCIQCIL